MYPFNKERALRGEVVISGYGRIVKGLKHHFDPQYPLLDENEMTYTDSGAVYFNDVEHLGNLYMAEPDKIEADFPEVGEEETIICRACKKPRETLSIEFCLSCFHYIEDVKRRNKEEKTICHFCKGLIPAWNNNWSTTGKVDDKFKNVPICGSCVNKETENMLEHMSIQREECLGRLPNLSKETTPKVEIITSQIKGDQCFYFNVYTDDTQQLFVYEDDEYCGACETKIGMIKITLNKKDFIKEEKDV